MCTADGSHIDLLHTVRKVCKDWVQYVEGTRYNSSEVERLKACQSDVQEKQMNCHSAQLLLEILNHLALME